MPDEYKDFVDAHIRFPPELHEALTEAARENYISLNKLVVIVAKRWLEGKQELDL